MDDPQYTDDDLAAFFGSPDARHAALEARRAARSGPSQGDGGMPTRQRPAATPQPASPEDDELAAFFGSPDAPSGDGASRAARYAPPPAGPAAPPPPTGPAAERRRRVARGLAVVLALIGIGVFAGLGVIAYLSRDLPSFEQIENTRNVLSTQVLTADGVELARYYDGENRTWVSLDEMSAFVPTALIATEDRRFFEHWGVDGYAIGAIIKDFLTGRGARGASTITMQLSRNLYRDATGYQIGERSVVRKAKEILIAVRLERTYTKPEILEAYLNTVPFLYNAYGIEAASQTFFAKPAADLDASEAAALIGMLAANSRYNPCLAPGGTSAECLDAEGNVLTESQNQAAIARRDVVLSNMRAQGELDEAAYRAAVEAPIALDFNVYSHEDNLAPHFAEVLRLWLNDWADKNNDGDFDDEGEINPYAEGLIIHTTIDSRMQALAAAAVDEQMAILDRTVGQSYYGSAARPYGTWWNRNTTIVNEYIRQTDRFRGLRAGGAEPGEAVAELRQSDVFMDSLRTARMRLEAGLVAMDPRSGNVKAWVGGRNFIVNKYDHAGQARRQPGSTFKLFVYATAFNNGFSPQASVHDSPFRWGDWSPQNSGGGYRGYTSLAEALQQSRNVVAARITRHFGTAEIARTAYQMGVRSPLELPEFDAETCPPFEARKNDCYPRSIGLGTQGVTLLEMVTSYATIANYGVYHGPTLDAERPANNDIPPQIVLAIDRIEDRYGNVVQDFTPVDREVVNPSTAYVTFDAMRRVVSAGTGRGLANFAATRNLDIAGKTGTTQDNADGWFMAMTPELVVGSWTGFDDRRITYPNTAVGQGGRTGLRNVGAFLQKLQTEGAESIRLDPDRDLEQPEDYQPPTSRRMIDRAGAPVPGRSRRSSRSNDLNRSAPSPARDLLNRAPAPRRESAPEGGRIGW